MKRKNATRNALFTSILSLMLCVSMLVGTTFAWFTDQVVSGNNLIAAGNLDVELEYYKNDKWESVEAKTDLFSEELWEPGHTQVVYLKLSNKGSLALKYNLGINVASEVEGTNVADKTFKLSDNIYMGVVENAKPSYTSREEAISAAKNGTNGIIGEGYTKPGIMTADADDLYLAVVVYMPETVGNEANYKTGTKRPEINLGIKLFATQMENENDSFGSDYDKGAAWTGIADIDWYLEDPQASEYILTSGEELAGLAAIVNGTATAPATTYTTNAGASTIKDDFKGKTIKLGADINLNDVEWTPIGDNANPFRGDFDGKGYTISNLRVINSGWAGLIGHAGLSGKTTIKNVNIDGAFISSNRMVGAVAGQLYGDVDNCHVKNATIIVTPNAVEGGYDNGDKVGAIVGWLGDNGQNRVISNCTAENVDLGAYRDVGGIAGYVASSTTVKNNSVKNAEITVDQTTNYYGDKDFNAGKIYGRTGGDVTDDGNTFDELTSIDITYAKDGLILKQNGEPNKIKLYLVPASLDKSTIAVPDGVTEIGNYAFAYNNNVKEVVLPSTVEDLGRGFDSSTVEKVILNEGLETISSRAFRSTTALKEVVISSTVKTIADNAFQKSGIKTITIPATVETIGETAFGASLVETVIFEGNTSIQGFAFRGCTKLRTVYMYGEDVTFIPSTLNGRNSCWFCNGESNNANTSNITFYVVNETIKDRVLTAMGAEKNNTPVIILNNVADGLNKDADGNYYVSNANGLQTLNTMMVEKTAGQKVVVNLTADIDFSGKTWSPVDSHADTAFTLKEINGNGNTISNLTINGQAMFTRFAGFGDVTIKDITFDKATVNSNGNINTSILTVQSYQNVLLDNVDVKNSAISGGYKVAPLIATVYNESPSAVTATLKNCDVSDTVVTATSYDFCTAGMVAFVYEGDNDKVVFENCTVTNVQLKAKPNGYNSHAWVYVNDADTDDCFNEVAGVTVTGCTFEAI